MRLVPAALLVAALALDGCSREATNRMRNIRPPKPGTPAEVDDVVGIYRSLRQDVLQLKATGVYSLITRRGASKGTYQLQDGRLVVQSAECGAQAGEYRVEVTGEQEAGKAMLRITGLDDGCQPRLQDLTAEPWVYSNS